MNKFLLQIPALLQKPNFCGANQGLLNGNTGLVIFLYHFSRITQNAETEKMADNLLDRIFDSLATTAPTDFENGLAGIGWGIEYLVQNGFAEGNTDEILEEVDTKIYKILCEDNLNSFELTNGLTGYLVYLNARLKNGGDINSMARRINKELLIHTINKTDEVVTSQFPSIVKEQHFDLFWRFPAVLFALTEACGLGIYNRKIEQVKKQWIMYFEAYIPSLHINRLYLALVLHRLNRIFQNQRIEKQIQILLFATNVNEITTEFDSNYTGIRYGWPGAVWVLHQVLKSIPRDYPNYDDVEKSYNQLKEKITGLNSNLLQNQAATTPIQHKGIGSGVTGVALMDLLWPEIFNNQ